MTVRPLVLDVEAHAQIKRVKTYADVHRVSLHDLMGMLPGRGPEGWVPRRPVGDDPKRVCHFFDGYRVVYSIEQQPDPTGWCHHLSVSVDVPPNSKLGPSLASVVEIARAFGFDVGHMLKGDFDKVHLFIETIDGNPVPNIVAKI